MTDQLRVSVEGGCNDLEGYVSADADLDGSFILTTDDGERFRVNGWTCDVEVLS